MKGWGGLFVGQTVGCGGGEVSSYPEFKCGKQGHGNPEKWGSVKNSEYESKMVPGRLKGGCHYGS